MTKGSSGPEYIPSKEERRLNREKARGASPGSEGLSPTTGGEAGAGELLSHPEDPALASQGRFEGSFLVARTPWPGVEPHAMTTEAQGRNGVVSFDGHFVTISRKGFVARATIGKGEKRIRLVSIAAVQFKPAGGVMNGFIQFTLPGGSERRSKFGKQTSDAAKDENTVMFTSAQMPQFLALRDAIEQAIAARSAPQTSAPVAANPIEQIQQLAGLRDQGLLSQEEFDAKKSELLSRM